MSFFEALSNPNYGFLRVALAVGVLISVACGVIGSYVVMRRISYIAGGISHCVLGGLGAAEYLRATQGWTWLHPTFGALVAALAAAAIIGLVSLRSRQREDTIISALWAIGMATGVIFIHITPGYRADLSYLLFGDILMVQREDVWLIFALDAIVVALGVLLFNQFQAICFDEEFARLRGLPVEALYLLLLGLTALTVVLLMSVVGIVLVIALLTLPVAVAGYFGRSLWQVMIVATVLCAALTTGGLAISFPLDLPAGATTILLAGALYLLAVIGAQLVRRRPARR